MKPFFLIATLLFIFFAMNSCSKSDDSSSNSNSDTQGSSIVGIWLLNKIRVNEIGISGNSAGHNGDTSFIYNDGSYADFRNNGIVYSANFQNQGYEVYDTASYQISGSSLIFIPNNKPAETVSLLTLNRSLLSIYKSNVIVYNNPQYPNENCSYEQKLYFYYSK